MFPLSLPSLHFSPLRYRPHGVGDWSGHIPFACDLVASLRPSLFVELGTHFGESFFAFCQAMAENGVAARAYAVDTWRGDLHTGAYGDEVFREVDEYNREHYGRFSRLLRMLFDEAAGEFEAESIDLLHIDGVHTYEAIRHDFDMWWPKVKPGGMVLLHDSFRWHDDFGVWKLLHELRQSLTATEFFHSNGLGVILKAGATPDEGIVPLLFRSESEMQELRSYYEVCADHLEHKFWLARKERPADCDISMQLFWRSEDEPFTESASVRVAHTATAERSRIPFRVPGSSAPVVELRVQLTDRRAFLELHSVSLLDTRGEVLWSAENVPQLEELRNTGLRNLAAEDGSGVLVLDPPAGASFVIPVAPASRERLQDGGRIMVEMSGVDPWCFVSKIAAPMKLERRSRALATAEDALARRERELADLRKRLAAIESSLPWRAVRRFSGFLFVLGLLCISHLAYYSLSSVLFTSPDEGHYMSGALGIANGIRTGTLSGTWAGYEHALGFKPPLICVPAALFMLFTKSITAPFCLQLVLTFAALGLACYSLFRNCYSSFQASAAAVIVLCTPLVNGLTHRYYVELLVLLLTVVTMDLLVRFGWRSTRASVLIGIVIGLGLLTKITFALFLILPILFCIWWDARRAAGIAARAVWIKELGNVAIASLIALALAASWYAKNLSAALQHARDAASDPNCYYPHWLLADLSAGPSVFVSVLALIGVFVVVKRLMTGNEDARAFRAWVVILLVGLSTAVGIAATVNKSTRFQVTWLPVFAAIAVAAWSPVKSGNWFRIGPAATAFVAAVLALHNSFGILPIGPIGFGDLKILDSRFQLNPPDFFNDNGPADERNYRLRETEARIAADATVRFGGRYSPEALTTQSGLLFNHYYFDFLSAILKHPVHYMTWRGHSAATGPEAEYIVYTRGFDRFYPGKENRDFYPQIEEDVAAKRIPYQQLFQLDGPAGSKITVLVRR